MLVFDKHEIKEQLTLENIYELLVDWGGEPEYTQFGLISSTICHNAPGIGSRKLYYYTNSNLFRCYTGCAEPNFDVFELLIKIADIQWHQQLDLNNSIRWIANHFGFNGTYADEEDKLEDWKYLDNYSRLQEIEVNNNHIILPNYDDAILSRFNYELKIEPWLREGISEEAMRLAQIGYYLGGDQITIPHFDSDGRFIGLRGRCMCQDDAELYGKYRPIKVNSIMYNHPLGFNLYGLNQSKNNIRLMKKAIVFESEKSQLLYGSYFGVENNISVACCGSSLSNYQVQLLIECGAEEIIIAFDRQFKEIADNEFKKLKNNLLKIREKHKQDVLISFIFDKNMITDYKSSPIDHGPEIFLQLFKERIVL